MGNKALKKEIERLEAALSEERWKINSLQTTRLAYEEEMKRLRDGLTAEREKYAALLEKYISMMEARVRENE